MNNDSFEDEGSTWNAQALVSRRTPHVWTNAKMGRNTKSERTWSVPELPSCRDRYSDQNSEYVLPVSLKEGISMAMLDHSNMKDDRAATDQDLRGSLPLRIGSSGIGAEPRRFCSYARALK